MNFQKRYSSAATRSAPIIARRIIVWSCIFVAAVSPISRVILFHGDGCFVKILVRLPGFKPIARNRRGKLDVKGRVGIWKSRPEVSGIIVILVSSKRVALAVEIRKVVIPSSAKIDYL